MNILVIAPHPDDETLGVGGTILKHKSQGDKVHWLIMTTMIEENGFEKKHIQQRAEEIRHVNSLYSFDSFYQTNLPTAELDTIKKSEIVSEISQVIQKIKPDTVYIPFRNDVHSDHGIIFDCAVSATKTFRYPFIKSVYTYETLSETEFNISPDSPAFKPNLFIDITGHLSKKIKIMQCYTGELGQFPFPRSSKCLESLAFLRGSQANCAAAEAFIILKEVR